MSGDVSVQASLRGSKLDSRNEARRAGLVLDKPFSYCAASHTACLRLTTDESMRGGAIDTPATELLMLTCGVRALRSGSIVIVSRAT